MTSKESDKIFDEATRIAGAYRAEHKLDREWPPVYMSQHDAAKAWEKPLVRGKPGCDPLGEDNKEPLVVPENWDDKLPSRRLLPADSAARKEYPICSGLLDYFPDACAEVAHISFLGNQKHNPGEPLHWARGKSMDHADCILRHLTERGTLDAERVRHSAQLAWRALALLQEELEAEQRLSPPRGATEKPSYKIHGYTQMPSPTSPYHDDATEIP